MFRQISTKSIQYRILRRRGQKCGENCDDSLFIQMMDARVQTSIEKTGGIAGDQSINQLPNQSDVRAIFFFDRQGLFLSQKIPKPR